MSHTTKISGWFIKPKRSVSYNNHSCQKWAHQLLIITLLLVGCAVVPAPLFVIGVSLRNWEQRSAGEKAVCGHCSLLKDGPGLGPAVSSSKLSVWMSTVKENLAATSMPTRSRNLSSTHMIPKHLKQNTATEGFRMERYL